LDVDVIFAKRSCSGSAKPHRNPDCAILGDSGSFSRGSAVQRWIEGLMQVQSHPAIVDQHPHGRYRL
jgi:hypothetical protein